MNKMKLGIALLLCIIVYGLVFFPFSGEMDVSRRLSSPSIVAPFGFDALGRNLFFEVAKGALVSISISLATVAISMVLGLFIAYMMSREGFLSNVFSVVCDTFKVIPPAILALFLASISGSGVVKLVIALSMAASSNIARTMYMRIAVMNKEEYVCIASSYGKSNISIFIEHQVIQLVPYIREQGMSLMLSTILTESALSYLGCGVGVSTVSLGSILSNARGVVFSYPHATIFPSIVLIVLASSLVLISKGMEDCRRTRFY